jgi:hypothetical protein
MPMVLEASPTQAASTARPDSFRNPPSGRRPYLGPARCRTRGRTPGCAPGRLGAAARGYSTRPCRHDHPADALGAQCLLQAAGRREPERYAGKRGRPNDPQAITDQHSCWSVACVEPPAGIEPATPSLPWNHQEPLCAPPFPQVATDRRDQSCRFSFGEVMRSHAWESWSLKQIILRPGVHTDRPLPTARRREEAGVPADRRR